MKRKNRTWAVSYGPKWKPETVVVTAKTYGAACRRAFKLLGVNPATDLNGGWEKTSAEVIA